MGDWVGEAVCGLHGGQCLAVSACVGDWGKCMADSQCVQCLTGAGGRTVSGGGVLGVVCDWGWCVGHGQWCVWVTGSVSGVCVCVCHGQCVTELRG